MGHDDAAIFFARNSRLNRLLFRLLRILIKKEKGEVVRVYHGPWGLVTRGEVIPAADTYTPVSAEEARWLARMTAAGLADGYETHELVLEIDRPIPPFCQPRHGGRNGYPERVIRTTRPDLCLVRDRTILFTELKSSLCSGPLQTVWKLVAARAAIRDYEINFLLVFTSDKLIYSSLKPRQVRGILARIGEDPNVWAIRSANALLTRIAQTFPKRYPEDAFGDYNYEAMPVAS